jgi:two-component system, chemotaxis family, chemotaxis protein CheY
MNRRIRRLAGLFHRRHSQSFQGCDGKRTGHCAARGVLLTKSQYCDVETDILKIISAPHKMSGNGGRGMGLEAGNGARRIRTIHDLGVLLIEDDDFTRKLISRLLYDIRVRLVFEASDGVQALDVLRKNGHDVDIAICDLEMPRMGGLDLLHALRTATGNPLAELPVIVLTGHREADMVKRAIAYGISGYLVKPVSKTDLMKRLGFALQQRAQT